MDSMKKTLSSQVSVIDEKMFSQRLNKSKEKGTNSLSVLNKTHSSLNENQIIRRLNEKIIEYETIIRKLEEEIVKQKDLNKTLLISITRKDEYLLKVIKENKNLTNDNNFIKLINDNVINYNMINIDEYKSLCRNKSMILSQPLNLKNTLNKLNNDLCFKKNCFAKISNSTNKLLEQK